MNFAKFYDLMLEDFDYNIFLETFYKYLKTTNKIVDLGCGTGSFLAILLNDGYNAIGIDNDLEMLELAKRKITAEDVLYYGDIIDLNIKADVFFMLFDVINYNKDYQTIFTNIYNNLYDDGLLIFDFYKPRVIKKYHNYNEIGDDYHWDIKISNNKIIHSLNFYNKNKTIIQYIHNKKALVKTLKTLKFKVKFIKGPDKRKYYLVCKK